MTEKNLCVESLRHAEYYGMQETFDELYAQSKDGKIFTDLMSKIISRENILLAYRNIKTNAGSKTAGTDKLTIKDVGKLAPDELVAKVRFILSESKHGYRPKPVRRKEIPKLYEPTKTRPLGIPCIFDRLIQQCIKQIMEPICEAKFSKNSYGFRPGRCVEHAISHTYRFLQLSHLHYVIEFDIKGFFDNVDHSKLIRQIWAMGIRDKQLIFILKRILTAPVKMPDGKVIKPKRGTPQGGIISPLLANIVLNELDQWIVSQWEENPVVKNYKLQINSKGLPNKGHGYRAMRKTNLKEMYIVRYADDFRIFCRTKTEAEKTKIAVTQWIKERLRLEISQEKTRVVNVKRQYSNFLGFKIRVHSKSKKQVVKSRISDKNFKQIEIKLKRQAKRISKPKPPNDELAEVKQFNLMVVGIQNYYRIATHISMDCRIFERKISTILHNRLNTQSGCRLKRSGRKLTSFEEKMYGDSKMLRYVAGTNEPIYPIGYMQTKKPMNIRHGSCHYTAEGREKLHKDLSLDVTLLIRLMKTSIQDSSEYADNRLSLFSAQDGKCAVTQESFSTADEIHCHHIVPRSKNGTDAYKNLILVSEPVHKLIHATKEETIEKYCSLLELNPKQLAKVNLLRKSAGLLPIKSS